MKITEKGIIEIDIDEIINSLDTDEQKKLVKSLAISPTIIGWVMDWICGEDEDGWWTTEHPLREQLLKRVEEKQIKNIGRYNWTLISKAADALKHYCSEKHLYYSLYYHPNADTMTIAEFCRSHPDGNQYQTKQAEEKIQEIIDIVKEAVRSNENC